MKARWISLGIAIGVAGTLMLGAASASDRFPATDQTEWGTVMEAMHDSPAMQQMHAQMPEELQALCDRMHEQMQQMMGGMMGGDMSAHHPNTGAAPGGPDGMMDAGGMMGSST